MYLVEFEVYALGARDPKKSNVKGTPEEFAPEPQITARITKYSRQIKKKPLDGEKFLIYCK